MSGRGHYRLVLMSVFLKMCTLTKKCILEIMQLMNELPAKLRDVVSFIYGLQHTCFDSDVFLYI